MIVNDLLLSPQLIDTISVDEIHGRYSIFRMQQITFIILYLSPSLSIEEFSSTIETAINTAFSKGTQSFVLAGDFNADFLVGASNRFHTLSRMMQEFGFSLANLIEPTHRSGVHDATMLDLIFTKNVAVVGNAAPKPKWCAGASSHYPVMCTITAESPRRSFPSPRWVIKTDALKVRETRSALLESLQGDITSLNEQLEEEINALRGDSLEEREKNFKFINGCQTPSCFSAKMFLQRGPCNSEATPV